MFFLFCCQLKLLDLKQNFSKQDSLWLVFFFLSLPTLVINRPCQGETEQKWACKWLIKESWNQREWWGVKRCSSESGHCVTDVAALPARSCPPRGGLPQKPHHPQQRLCRCVTQHLIWKRMRTFWRLLPLKWFQPPKYNLVVRPTLGN